MGFDLRNANQGAVPSAETGSGSPLASAATACKGRSGAEAAPEAPAPRTRTGAAGRSTKGRAELARGGAKSGASDYEAFSTRLFGWLLLTIVGTLLLKVLFPQLGP